MGDLQEYERVPLIEMRERIVTQLKLNYAHDNLDEAEFERLLDEAHAATSKKALIEVVQGLPNLEEKGQEPKPSNSPVALNEGRVQEQDTLVAILGGNERKGIWRPARRTNMLAVLGGIELDYSEAEFPPGVSEITIFTVMGGVELKVPEELNVEVQAIPILGGVENQARSGEPNSPTLRIKAVAVFGGVEIKTSKKGKQKRD